MHISDWMSDVYSSDLLHLFVIVHHLVGHAVDITAHDAIAGGAIDGVEADLRRFRRGRHHRHRTGDEGELQIALPEDALRHAGSTSGRAKRFLQIGRASWRERVGTYVWRAGGAGAIT